MLIINNNSNKQRGVQLKKSKARHCHFVFLELKKKTLTSSACDTFNCVGENKSSKRSAWLSEEFLMETDFT